MPNPASYFLGSSFVQKPAPASSPSSVAPTFGGITALNQNLDGSLQASWLAVTLVPNPPVRYEVYIQQSTATGLFNAGNLQSITPKLTQKIAEDAAGNPLQFNRTYFVGVRAVDAYGNRETNLISLSQTITYANFNTVASAVWDVVRATRNTPGTFGESLTARVDVDVSTRAATADARFANLDVTISSRATQTSVDGINTKLGTPVSASVSSDIAAVQTKLGTPALATVSADIAALNLDVDNVQTSVNAIPTNPLLTNDSRLNNLDATISSRASQSSINNIQNNTNFVGIVPAPIVLPETGTKTYPIYVRLFNNVGSPADPDLNEIILEVKNSAGSTIVSPILMTRNALGQYSYNYVVNSSDTEQALYFFFSYEENSIAFNQVRSTEVVEFESKLDTLLSRLTPARALNLDNLDATITSRASQSSIIAIDAKLGTPATGTVSSDIADVKADIAAVPTAAENADAVWDENVNDHATGTTTARTLKDAKIFSQIDL